MTTAKQIAKSLAALARSPYGAKYHKVDFHLHTPASEDARGSNHHDFNPYKTVVYPATNDHSWAYVQAVRQAQEATLAQARELAAKFVARFVEQGLRMVAITDHNSLGTIWPDPETRDMDLAAPTWYELIDDAAAQQREAGGESVVILPGVEISTTGVHILAIFPPTRPRRQVHFRICDLLTEIGIAVEEFGSNPARGRCSPASAVELIHRKGGVPIIAHIDGSDKALLELYEIGSTELSDVLCRPQLHAVEMVKPSRLMDMPKGLAKDCTLGQWIELQRAQAGLDGLAFFQGSDAHDLATIGKRYSYLMMSEPGFAGLYNAIHSPSSRVRVGELVDERPRDAVYVYGFELDHPLFGSASARFNRNLNCVVGGTDSGKSLLLSLLQHAVDETSELGADVKLFLERRRDATTNYYCFARRGAAAIELFELREDDEGAFVATPVAAEHPDYQALRPRFYDPVRMREVIGSREGLQRFLLTYTGGEPNPARIEEFNARFDFRRFLSATADPLLQLSLDDAGGLTLSLNVNWRRGRPKLQGFDAGNDSLKRLMVMLIVLVSSRGPVIIDEPAELFDNADISHYLVPLIKLHKGKTQMILATKNANLAVNADPENYLLLEQAARGKRKVTIESGFAIDQSAQRERLIALLEGDHASFARRGVLYGDERAPG